MRALLLHITIGAAAALSFFAALLAFDTGGVRHLDTLGLTILFGLVAMFFLSTQLILSRLSQDDVEERRVRVSSRDQRR
ncbi:hypothetical protein PARPLA_02684 [Rhodobacteraceae bacterium THAF1]|uniref:hypothetical protein n=1 Tax=Palleronia sp. THAF1 TaxID=2587842 RepID=UPI000F40D737|nr:hypothetical protein [Palleronia sp. THAF1]QFU08676.1 hypothetical protein FIU81_08320 [Palleronia sp. THAF1]VDC28423.1 hypothetical protein PARPLA_02684 [Rhodobacteraceae bacterium THAF1]